MGSRSKKSNKQNWIQAFFSRRMGGKTNLGGLVPFREGKMLPFIHL
jgi:hypothetical protein